MPLVKIEIVKGHTQEYKKALLNAVHDALEIALGIPAWDRFQRLYEIEAEYFERNDEKTDNFCLIELTIFPGRSKETKGTIIQEITRLLGERLGIMPTDIFIVLHDPPLENWGIGGIQRGNEK
ncbi:MAG: tautomerase family protein [Bacillota bacterium]